MARTIKKAAPKPETASSAKTNGKPAALNPEGIKVSADGRNFHTVTACIRGFECADECPVAKGEANGVYNYQRSCRAEPCRTANSEYYKAFKIAKKAAAAVKAAKRTRKAAAK